MKKLLFITLLLVALSGLVRSVNAQTSVIGYASNVSGEIHKIDLSTATSISSFSTGGIIFQAIALDSTDTTLFCFDQNGLLYSIDITAPTPTPTFIGDTGLGTIEAADFNFDGSALWVTDFVNFPVVTIFSINTSDATATPVQTIHPGVNDVVRAMAAETTKDVWIANDNFPSMDFQSVDTNIAPPDTNVTHIGFLDDDPSAPFFITRPKIRGMDRGSDGVLYGVTEDGRVYSIDQDPNLDDSTTARLSLIGNTGGHSWTALATFTTSSSGGPAENQPPVADAGDNLTIDSSQQLSTILNGTASDPDVDDSLTYRWLEGTTELLASTSVVDGVASLDLNSLSLFSIGSHTLTLEVSDGQAIATDEMILTIENSPPVVAPSGGGTFQLGDNITLSGQVSDFDGDLLVYKWFEGANEFTTVSGFPTLVGGDPVDLGDHVIIGGLPLGNHIITLEANDNVNAPVSENIVVDVIDTTAPTISATACPCILWPPNHKLEDVAIQVDATDESGSVTLSVTVESSEPPNDTGDGNTEPDFTEPVIDQTTGLITLQLMSERKGNGSGRTYTITITATDSSGNTSESIIQCLAPHDMGNN